MKTTPRVGVCGIGIMGKGMADNLVSANFDVSVWNRTQAKAEAVRGATVASSPRALAESVDVVVICVSDTMDVAAVVGVDPAAKVGETFADDSLLAGMPSGSLVVDCSTISPDATRRFAQHAAARGVSWVDAPVSGGSEGATKGTLSAMVGGSDEDIAAALPVLEAFCASITHVGSVGAGQVTKIINQVLVVVNQLAVSEALTLARLSDLDLEKVLEAVTGGAAGSWMLENRGPQMIADDWRPGFTIDLQQKDLRLALAHADDVGAPLPGTALVFQLYRTLQARGLGGEGNHALVKAIEALVNPGGR